MDFMTQRYRQGPRKRHPSDPVLRRAFSAAGTVTGIGAGAHGPLGGDQVAPLVLDSRLLVMLRNHRRPGSRRGGPDQLRLSGPHVGIADVYRTRRHFDEKIGEGGEFDRLASSARCNPILAA